MKILWLFILLLTFRKHVCKLTRSGPLRVVGGYEANATDYPYIISINNIEHGYHMTIIGSGLLLTPFWVLSASHVFAEENVNRLVIEYGSRAHSETKPLKQERNLSRVNKVFLHPFNEGFFNDIALANIVRADVSQYARLSSIDHTTLIGLPVKFAGYGYTTYDGYKSEDYDRLYFGEGGVIPCDDDNSVFYPSICVVPKCSDLWNIPHYGDSGGPLFYDNSVVGVLGGSAVSLLREERDPVSEYTPVSPYLDWILRLTTNFDERQAHNKVDVKESTDKTKILRSDKKSINEKREEWTQILIESKARKRKYRKGKFGIL